jgi:hypothetical protein
MAADNLLEYKHNHACPDVAYEQEAVPVHLAYPLKCSKDKKRHEINSYHLSFHQGTSHYVRIVLTRVDARYNRGGGQEEDSCNIRIQLSVKRRCLVK